MLQAYFLNKHLNQFEIQTANYSTIKPRNVVSLNSAINEKGNTNLQLYDVFPSLQEYPCANHIKISTWDFLNREQVQKFMQLEDKQEIRQFINDKCNSEYPKGAPKLILTELIYSLRKFINKMNFHNEQISALLSIFNLTHQFFTSSNYISAESVYEQFKDYLITHSITFFPDFEAIFTTEDAAKIMIFFTKLYLRHLPLIRLLSLPNFGFHLFYELPPEPALGKKKKEKGKKKDKKKKKK